jgi:hypothetical protein
MRQLVHGRPKGARGLLPHWTAKAFFEKNSTFLVYLGKKYVFAPPPLEKKSVDAHDLVFSNIQNRLITNKVFFCRKHLKTKHH